MATEIADRNNGLNFSNGDNALPAPAAELSKLEIARLAIVQEQKKRIDAAVARVTAKKESGKRKAGDAGGHRSKKSKTVVDVANDQLDKKNSIARRMVDRFASMPEPEQEAEHQVEPTTRSVSTQQFVSRATSVEVASSPVLGNAQREATEKVMKKVAKTVKVTEKNHDIESKEDEVEEKEEEEMSEWDGPTTNFHVKQLGLDDKVDIYAPILQQQEDVQRVRQRVKYMPSSESIDSLKMSSSSDTEMDFVQTKISSNVTEKSDTSVLPDVDASKICTQTKETEEIAQRTRGRAWIKRLFVFTPLFVVAIVVLALALLFAIDWSQETFQFCEVNSDAADGSDDMFSCTSFLETQSLVKSTLRENVKNVQETMLSYFE